MFAYPFTPRHLLRRLCLPLPHPAFERLASKPIYFLHDRTFSRFERREITVWIFADLSQSFQMTNQFGMRFNPLQGVLAESFLICVSGHPYCK